MAQAMNDDDEGHQIAVTVENLGINQNLKMRSTMTVADVKAHVNRGQTTPLLEHLSFNGQKVYDDQKLSEIVKAQQRAAAAAGGAGAGGAGAGAGGANQQEKITLVGQIALDIVDPDCKDSNLSEHFLKKGVYLFSKVEDVRTLYREQAGRVAVQPDAILYTNAAGPSAPGSRLDDSKTLFESNIEHDATIYFKNTEFEVQAIEVVQHATSTTQRQERQTLVRICDTMTVAEVKRRINERLDFNQQLLEDDKLLYNDLVLQDTHRIFRTKIRNDSKIFIHRTSASDAFGDPRIKYVCGECGAFTRLKRHDTVMCQSCGYKILYKTRTTQKTCEYLAR